MFSLFSSGKQLEISSGGKSISGCLWIGRRYEKNAENGAKFEYPNASVNYFGFPSAYVRVV